MYLENFEVSFCTSERSKDALVSIKLSLNNNFLVSTNNYLFGTKKKFKEIYLCN